MPTKTQPRTDRKGRRLAQRALYADEAYWVGLAARLQGISMHEFMSRRVREYVRKVLVQAGIDPDESWSAVGGN